MTTYENQLWFYILTMKYLKEKLRKQSHYRSMKNSKYLGINLTMEVKDVYNEYSKTLMKEKSISSMS